MTGMRKEDYDFYLEMDLAPYAGEWIAICDRKVVAHAKSFKEAHAEAVKLCGEKRPLMAQVFPDDLILV